MEWWAHAAYIVTMLAFYFVGRWLGYRKGFNEGFETQQMMKFYKRQEPWGTDDHIT